MFQDFEKVENPELISQFEECYKRACQEAELQEMLEKGEITEDDLSPTYKSESPKEDISEKELNDLPF